MFYESLGFFQTIVNLVAANQVVVISGETGCGKTTQVKKYSDVHSLFTVDHLPTRSHLQVLSDFKQGSSSEVTP